MNLLKLIPAAILAGACSLAVAAPKSSGSAPEIRMYRYVNDQGTTVTSNQIPPQYAKKGYKVVNTSGDVIEEVPPELSEEEKKKMDANRISEARQKEKDKLMLLKYSNVSELIQARDRHLTELSNKIKTQEANLVAIDSQIRQEQQNAATFERGGREVPATTLKKLEDLYKDQQIAQDQIKTFKANYDVESKQFEEDIARYEYLRNQKVKRDVLEPPPPRR